MHKVLTTVTTIAILFLAAPAHAAVIDFAVEADTNGERGLAAGGEAITIDGVDLILSASDANGDSHAYLDASTLEGPAGLGACGVLTVDLQCNPSSDDNVQAGESVTIEFASGAFTVGDLVFRDDDHYPLTPANDGLVTITNTNGTLTELFSAFIAKAQGGDAFFADLGFITFEHAGADFYLMSLDLTEAPLPAALPLLLSGLGAFGFAARKRKKRA